MECERDPPNREAMGNLLPKWDFLLLMHTAGQWLHKWDGDLDRVERFASTFGDSFTRKMDMGFIALASALFALFGLLFG
jgi:hypothetical protein